ncbi:MAG TPA: hypothetical protein VFV38_23910 [Ktedonobacteraceae bacterium]|nr:hypothetical protein [Ktedonobacteraceae bacterium]
MDTIDQLLSLAELRMQTRDVRGWRQQAPRFLHLLHDLPVEEGHLLSQRLLAQYPLQEEADDEVLLLLAQINTFHPGALVPLLPMLVARQQFSPGHLYLGAGEDMCQQMLELLHAPSQGHRGQLLQVLAWMGTKAVQAQFSTFRLHPPVWRTELFVPPENYSQEAGWELTADGRRRDLYFSTCYELIPVDLANSSQSAAEPTMGQEHCVWCQRPLQRVLDLDLRDPRCRWITAEGERLCLAVCARCSFYATTYLDITLGGEAHWSPLNGEMPALLHQIPDDGDMVELPAPLGLGKARSTPFEAVGRFLLDEPGTSQFGGHPEWIQDAFYPQCPACQQTMSFLGQIAFEDWEDGEGVFYLFLCLSCKKAATHYQQT